MRRTYQAAAESKIQAGHALLRRGLLCLLLVLATPVAAEAVSVSPTALYIDSRTRTGVLTLHNPGTLPEEISIGFGFGYPQSDMEGRIRVDLLEEVPEGEPSAVEWMRAFPRRLVLQPGQRQVVRIIVQPPANLAEGEYWGRLVISSRGGQPPIEQTQGGAQMQLTVETVLVMAANYRHGAVATGVDVAAANATRTGDRVDLQLDLERTGNAAMLGRVRADVVDANGGLVASIQEEVAVYRTLRRRLSFDLPASATGPMTVRLRISAERSDLPSTSLLPFAPVTLTVPVHD